MRDIIFVSLEDWDEVWRRNQFLCATLAQRYPDRKILFVGLAFNVSHHLLHGSVQKLRGPITWSVPGFPNITVTHPVKLFPDSWSFGRKINEWMARFQIRRLARRLGMKDAILWLNPLSSLHMARRMGEHGVIYDITDDWTLQPSLSPSERRYAEEQDRALCERADAVIVCSEALLKSRRPLSRRIALIPNGVDVRHYEKVLTRPESRSWSAPVFGYTGTLHSERTDARLIISLARAFPNGSVVLIGPDHWTSADRKLLASERNIHMPGAVPYAKIPEVMTQFDVCIVPHVETKFTESLNPIKLWEYLAGGKPVVAANIAGFRDYPQLCRIASGPEAFISACRAALSEQDNLSSKRIAEARHHTWDARVDALLALLVELRWISADQRADAAPNTMTQQASAGSNYKETVR